MSGQQFNYTRHIVYGGGLFTDDRFLKSVAALLDIYTVVGEGSEAQQNTKLLPWEVVEAYTALVDKLEEMADVLDGLKTAGDPKSASGPVARAVIEVKYEELWPTYSQFGKRLKDEVSYSLDTNGKLNFEYMGNIL